MRDETRLAAEAANAAGAALRDGFERAHHVELKSRRELVTEMDRAAESLIIAAIRNEYPDDDMTAEESSPGQTASGRAWIIDPLDGTNNYAHGYPFFSVSIAFEEGGALVSGVVYDPVRDELFVAEAGSGATLNGSAVRVSDVDSVEDAIVATGFPYDRTALNDNNLANLNRFILSARGIRRAGSAALDLVYVACGRLDGYWELGLKAWDVSAGGLIVREAGGHVTNFASSAWSHQRGDIVASNGRIHGEMQSLIG